MVARNVNIEAFVTISWCTVKGHIESVRILCCHCNSPLMYPYIK